MSDQHDHLALTPEVKPPPLEAVEKVDYNDVSDFAEIPELERGIVRKVDMRILPPLWVMYWLNYLDRNNIGNAQSAGMGTDLHLTSTQYSLAVSIFFIGYLLLQVPSNMILHRTRPRFYLPGTMLAWGCMVLVYLAVRDAGGLIAVRLCLRIIEAGFFPGALFYMSRWYKRNELAKRYAAFYSASLLAGAFGGLLAGAILSGLEGTAGLPAWKWLFLRIDDHIFLHGRPLVLPDWPTNTRWLTPEEREYAVKRLLAERSSESAGETGISHLKALSLAVKDWKVWFLALSQNLAAAAGTITYFVPTLTEALGYAGRMSQFMTVPVYAVALVMMISFALSSDKLNERPWHIFVSAITGAVSCAIVADVDTVPVLRYVFFCFALAGIQTTVMLNFVLLGNSFGRPVEKRAVAIAIVNGVANLASVYGSYIWPSNTAPRYIPGFVSTTCFMGGVMICALVYRFVYPRFPDRVDRSGDAGGVSGGSE